MILETLKIDRTALEQRTGWEIKPEGACKGEVCIPLPDDAVRGDILDARVLADRLGAPLVADDAHGVWSFGPESGGRALTTAEAPDLVLPDFDGKPFSLRSLRGQKVLLIAWASW